MLLAVLRLGLLGAVCCLVSTAPVCDGYFLMLPAALALLVCFRTVLLVRVPGTAFRLRVCLVGFPTVVNCYLFPPLRLFVNVGVLHCPATVSSPPQALGPVGVVCGRACVSLRPCLCITKPVLGVQAWPGLARQSSRVFGRRGVAPAPRL